MNTRSSYCYLLLAMAFVSVTGSARAADKATKAPNFEAYLRPYVLSKNFSGAVLVVRDDKPLFSRAYGRADAKSKKSNTLRTRFHIASMSMQFTAAAILRLADAGELTLETPVSTVIPDYPRGEKITVRHLLTQTSGIADINNLPDYDNVIKTHQDADSLVAKVRDLPLVHEPGGDYKREEHSAYNLLALIVEKVSGSNFKDAMRRLVFRPLGMNDSGIDDDSSRGLSTFAKGYSPVGVSKLESAQIIHWSAKTGSGSAFSTALDEAKWVRGLFGSSFLSDSSRKTMFELTPRVGFGWVKKDSKQFGMRVYSMTGRAPGFASAISYFPDVRLGVVVLSNIYSSSTAQIGDDLAALALDKPLDGPVISSVPPAPKALVGIGGRFEFGEDFYQPKAIVSLQVHEREVTLVWPSGDASPLLPGPVDHFVDRSYWMPVELIRSPTGEVVQLKYGTFVGTRVPG